MRGVRGLRTAHGNGARTSRGNGAQVRHDGSAPFGACRVDELRHFPARPSAFSEFLHAAHVLSLPIKKEQQQKQGCKGRGEGDGRRGMKGEAGGGGGGRRRRREAEEEDEEKGEQEEEEEAARQ